MKVGASKATTEKSEVRIFVSYSHIDGPVRAKLETHLATLKRDGVSTWYDEDLIVGDALDTGIARELRRAHIFVALLSPEYIASHYCWKLEYQRAMNRRARGAMRVVAVVVRPCDWKATQAAGFKLLPADGRPVSRWRSADEALLDVTLGIRRVVASVRAELATSKRGASAKSPAKTKAKPDTKRPARKTARTATAKPAGAIPASRKKGPPRPTRRK